MTIASSLLKTVKKLRQACPPNIIMRFSQGSITESLVKKNHIYEFHEIKILLNDNTICFLYLFADGRLRCNFTIGGVNYFKNFDDANWIESEKFNKNREGFYGWFGLGGSIVQWHPELQIGFAFIPTFLNVPDLLNSRGGVLQQIVKDCISAQK